LSVFTIPMRVRDAGRYAANASDAAPSAVASALSSNVVGLTIRLTNAPEDTPLPVTRCPATIHVVFVVDAAVTVRLPDANVQTDALAALPAAAVKLADPDVR
jgi:hypothetical protein